MFSRVEKAGVAAIPIPPAGDAALSHIGAGLVVEGDLETHGHIRIDGAVVGDIVGRSVTVGEGGYVEGSIVAQSVHIGGAFQGQAIAAAVTVAATARIAGTITHNSLSIERGALVEGLRPWRPRSWLEQRQPEWMRTQQA